MSRLNLCKDGIFWITDFFSVGQLTVRKCNECGQPLPENFEPPGDEPWTTGIFGCADDTESCKYVYNLVLYSFQINVL
jgi:hypothetical protein